MAKLSQIDILCLLANLSHIVILWVELVDSAKIMQWHLDLGHSGIVCVYGSHTKDSIYAHGLS